MADTLREVAQEAVAKAEGSTFDYKTTHGKQVAGALRAEADKDVFTSLQIAAGEQVSPAILRANIDVSIGVLTEKGKIERKPGTPYETRYNRAENAVQAAEKYFNDQIDFKDFLASTEGKAVVASTGKFLLTHPALTEYFAIITNMSQRNNAARELAKQYLQDPYAREKVRQALLDSSLNKGDVADEFSETEAKRVEMEKITKGLEATIKQIEDEIKLIRGRRAEYDKTPDPTAPKNRGEEYKQMEKIRSAIATQEALVSTETALIDSTEAAILGLRGQFQSIDKSDTVARASVSGEISKKTGDVAAAKGRLRKAANDLASEQKKLDAYEAERKSYDDKLQALSEKLKEAKDERQKMSDELRELTMKKARLEAGKGRSEELAVSELENIFKKGIEQELIERLERAKEAADKALEDSAAKSKDIDEKQYRELRAKRHKGPDGKIDGAAINEDFNGMMRVSAEYHIVENTDNSVHIYVKNDEGGWDAVTTGSPALGTPPGSETYYLTGPELAVIQMMNNTNEFGSNFILGKLKDTEWMQQEAQDFAVQTLRDKMYASRGWLTRRRTGVKRLGTAEIVKIKNSTWGVGMLEQALEQNKAHVAELDKVLGSELLTGPGSWREKIGRMSNKKLALLVAVLATGGAFILPKITIAGLGVAASALNQIPGAAVVGAGAGAATGLAIGHSGRTRTS